MAARTLLLFDRLPTWRLGLYGGPATPAFDAAAADGRVYDFAFDCGRSIEAADFEAVRTHPGCPADLSPVALSDPGRLNVETPSAVWDGLLAAWDEDGVEVGEDVQPADVPDLLRDDPDLLPDDLRWEVDEAAEFASLLERLAVAEADAWLADRLAEIAGRPFVVAARRGGGPLPRPDETLLDVERHAPLILGTAGVADRGPREGGLVDVADAADPRPQPSLRWADASGHAVTEPDLLAVFETDADRPRLFLKPDDRFCQLDVAPQRPDLVERAAGGGLASAPPPRQP